MSEASAEHPEDDPTRRIETSSGIDATSDIDAFADSMASPPQVRVTLLTADSAQVADRKLYVLGGGLSLIGPRPQPIAVAIHIEVPWDRANVEHLWRLDLLDEDGRAAAVGDKAVMVQGRFEAGRPVGSRPGTALAVPLAINFPALPLQPGRGYVWQLSVDGRTYPDWQQPFQVRSVPS